MRWVVYYDTIDLADLAKDRAVTVYRILADKTVVPGLLKNPDNDLVPNGSYIHQTYEVGSYVHLFEVEGENKYYKLTYEITDDETIKILVDGELEEYDKDGNLVEEY